MITKNNRCDTVDTKKVKNLLLCKKHKALLNYRLPSSRYKRVMREVRTIRE